MKIRTHLQFSFRTLLFVVIPLISLVVVWVMRDQTANEAVEVLRVLRDQSLITNEFEFDEKKIWNDSFWGRKPLKQVTDLKVQLNEEHVKAVSRLPAVKKLDISMYYQKGDWKLMKQLLNRHKSVEWITVTARVYDWERREGIDEINQVYSQIAKHQNLKRLTLHGGGMDFATAREFHEINLKTLELYGHGALPFAAINGLNLETLVANDLRVSDGDIAKLTFCRELRVLELSGNLIGGWGRTFRGFNQMRKLRRLNLSRNPLGGSEATLTAFYEAMKTLPALESLDLSHTNVSDEVIEALYKKLPLKDINLSHTLVTDEGLATLVKKFPMLEDVNVENSQVTSTGIKELEKLKHLRSEKLQ